MVENVAARESFDAWLLVKRQHEQSYALFLRLSESRAKVRALRVIAHASIMYELIL